MEFKLHNGSGGLCCKSCGRQDKQLNTYDWLADIPGNAEESDMVEVQFKNTRKGYFRNSNKIPLEKGDIVAVEATPGHDIGVVTLTGRLVPLQMRKANIKSEADIKRRLPLFVVPKIASLTFCTLCIQWHSLRIVINIIGTAIHR